MTRKILIQWVIKAVQFLLFALTEIERHL